MTDEILPRSDNPQHDQLSREAWAAAYERAEREGKTMLVFSGIRNGEVVFYVRSPREGQPTDCTELVYEGPTR